MKIETNMQNRPVTLTLPLPKDLSEEQLKNLAIYIEHSDGSKELLRGKVIDYQNDMLGLQFEVQNSLPSPFSICQRMKMWRSLRLTLHIRRISRAM